MPPESQRDGRFDTLKYLLICVVVFGHVIMAIGESRVELAVFNFIYSFHMPLFVFVSGYFSQVEDKSVKSIKNSFHFLSLYLLSNTAMWLVFPRSHNIKMLLTPNYAMWYMLSMFYWRMFSSFIMKKSWLKARYLCYIITISILVGFVPQIGEVLSFNRTVCFFCFFFAGMFCRKHNAIEYILKLPLWCCVMAFPIVFLYFYVNHGVQLEYIYCGSYGFNLRICAERVIQMGIAVICGMAFLRLSFLVKSQFIANSGSKTLFIYMFHAFITASMTRLAWYVDMPNGIILSILIFGLIMISMSFLYKIRLLNSYLSFNLFDGMIERLKCYIK